MWGVVGGGCVGCSGRCVGFMWEEGVWVVLEAR